jgi:Flp pilus assembly protein TadB
MRRFVLAALAVLAAGGAFFLREKSRSTSFSAYTEAQLDTLEANYRALSREPPTQGTLAAREEATLDAQLSLEWLQTERHRRLSLRAFALVALLAAVGALLPRRLVRVPIGQ